jgi:hypothetical protein
MKYQNIKNFNQRCEEHPAHQNGMITNSMIQERLFEEIDELRNYIEQALIKQGLENLHNANKKLGLNNDY